MFKNYILLFCLVTGTASVAQITITASDMPNAWDSVKVSETTGTAGADHTLTGANYNWDYSALTPNVQRYDKFDSPSTFPSPYNLLFSPFNTSYGQRNYQNLGSPLPGFTIEADYDFFKENSNCFKQNGIGYILNGIPIPMVYSKPDTIYDFPMDYADTMSCDFQYSTPSFAAVPFYYGESGHRESVVDGWGTLTTPYGTFPVLRVRSVITATDSIYLDTLGFGTAFPLPVRIEYKWITNGKKTPLLKIDASDIGGTEIVTNVVYQDSIRPEVPQVGITETATVSNITVYPNPASEQVTIEFNAMTSASIQICILNLLGQTVMNQQEYAAKGERSIRIDLQSLDLPPGIYGLCIENGSARKVVKLIIN
jgi:hypothetical protein